MNKDNSSNDLASRPPIQLAVFDLDGTLVDAFEDIALAVNHMLALDGLPPRSVEEVKRHVGRGVRMLLQGILGTNDPAVLEEKVRVLSEYYRQHPIRTACLYDGVVEGLEKLRAAGLRLAVASNKPHPLTDYLLRHLGVAQFFDWIEGQSDAFPRKPAPDVLHHFMKLAGAHPTTTVIVGDSPTDIEFARAAGAEIVCVTYGQCTREELLPYAPDAIVEDFNGVVTYVLERSKLLK